MKILVLGGGISPERQVSLRSAKAVADAAKQAGYEIVEADPADGLNCMDNLKDTIVFPILHGKNGEDGVIQKEIEARGLPFLGTDSAASIACFDKWVTRQKLIAAGLPMPDAALVTKDTYKSSDLSKRPHVLKINHGGSSIGTLIVRDVKNVNPSDVDELFGMESQAVLESLIDGTEITVPILDGKALPVIEIVPPPNGEFDYENKYNGQTQEIVPAKSVSPEIQTEARALAEKVNKTMGARHLSRIDMMIDKSGNLFVLEINTMPGMTTGSLYPKAAAAAGITMPELVKRFAGLINWDFKLEDK